MTQTQFHHADVGTAGESRWTGVGSSLTTDSFLAGVQAATAANAHDDAVLYLVFAGHRHDHEALLAGVASVASGDASVIGCSTGGEISLDGPTDDGVVVMALGGAGVSVATRCADIVGGDLRTAGEQVANAVWDIEDRGHTVLLLLSDGLAGDPKDVVRGAASTVGPTIPLVGGCAADGMARTGTTLFHADSDASRIGTGQVIGAAISSAGPLGIGVVHGWQAVGEALLVTKSAGNLVNEIDEEPALDRYLRMYDAPPGLADDAESFTRFAATHPIGVSAKGTEEVCFVSSCDPGTRALTTLSAVPLGATAHAMESTVDAALDATDQACTAALAQLDGPPIGLLVFDCVARRSVLGPEGVTEEVRRIDAHAGAPVAGFYTYGEFGTVGGVAGFHNQALVAVAIG